MALLSCAESKSNSHSSALDGPHERGPNRLSRSDHSMVRPFCALALKEKGAWLDDSDNHRRLGKALVISEGRARADTGQQTAPDRA